MTIKSMIEGVWKELPSPQGLTEIMQLMYELAGSQTIAKLETSHMECFLCGTEALAEMMKKQRPNITCMTLEGAHIAIDEAPELFFTVVQVMATKKDVDKLFPEPNPAYSKKGWNHLKEKQDDNGNQEV